MIMKKMVMFLSIILLSFVTVSYGQTISIPDAVVSPGTTVKVPIKAVDLKNVGAVTLKLTYNVSALTFKSFTNGDINFDPSLVNTKTAGEIKMAWFSTSPVTINNGVIGYVEFTYSSGSGAVNFATNECEITAIPFATITPTYINGSIGEAAAAIKVGSVEAKKADTVVVPITAVNLKNIGSMSLNVKYNTASLKFVDFKNVASSNIIVPATNTDGSMNIGYFSTSAASFDGKLFDIRFVVLGGNSDVTVSGTVTDAATKEMSVVFTPGTVKELLPPAVKVGLTIPAIRGLASKEVNVPVIVSEVNNIGSMSLKLKYDSSVLSFKEIKNFVGTVSNLASKEDNGVLTLGYFSTTPISIKNGKLFDVVFSYKGGTTDVSFDPSSTITDGSANTVTIELTKGSVSANQKPVMTAIADQSVKENAKLTFTVAATDAENDPLTFSAGSLPKGAAFDVASKTFTWTPSYTDAGKYSVKFFVADSLGSTDSTVANVEVVNVNRAPAFTKALKDTSVAENGTLTFTYNAADPDTGSVLSYSMTTTCKGATLDAKSGLFTFKPEFGTKGTYFVKVFASDGDLKDSTQNTMITVNFTNRKPVFTTVIKDTVKIAEAQSYSFKFAASDPDTGQTLTYAMIKTPTGSTIDSKTGQFTWTPNYGQKGTYDLWVSVSDGSLKDTTKAKIVVAFTNRLPVFNKVPTPVKTEKMLVYWDYRGPNTTDTTFIFHADDPDGQSLRYAIVSGPTTGTIQMNATTGLFHFKPASYGDWKLIVSVTDGYATVYDTTRLVCTFPVGVEPGLVPLEYSLGQNYPNPFNPTTKIKYSIPQESKVVLKIYNILGSEVCTLVNEVKAKGNYTVNFNASNLPSGLYVYRIEAGNYVSVRKMTLLK